MASWIILQPDDAEPDEAELKARFVRDDFTWMGFLVPVVWALYHRLWWWALTIFAATLLIGFLPGRFGLLATALTFAIGLLFGFEGRHLIVERLVRKGWREVGVVEAETLEEAELRWIYRSRESAFANSPDKPSARPPIRRSDGGNAPSFDLLHPAR